MKRKEIDMINGSIWNKLIMFAMPIAATAVLEQLFNASDVAVVGNFAAGDKTAAVAAVGANAPIVGLILNLFIGIALGTNVVIANAIGREDFQTVKKAVQTSLIMALTGGIAVMLIGEPLAVNVLRLLKIPDDMMNLTLLYLRIYLLGMPVIFLYNFEAAIFRSAGDTKTPLAALAVSGVINVILNLFFVIVLHMSVNGVAIATVISNTISSIILLIKLLKTDKCIHLDLKKFSIDTNIMKNILKIGLPAGIQSAVFALANIVIQAAINSLGTVVIAASSAAYNIEIFAYYVINSFGQACTTFVGQNYGAGKLTRCKRILALSLIEDFAAAGVTIAVILLFGKNILAIFNNDAEVISTGYVRLVMVFTAYIFTMLYEVMSGYMRGFGISLLPAILTTIGVCGVRIAWIEFVFPLNRTFQTIMAVYPLSLSVTALLIFAALLISRPSHRLSK